MSKNVGKFAIVLSIIAIVLSIAALVVVCKPADGTTDNAANSTVNSTENSTANSAAAERDGKDIQYVLYLGTNDKDTNEPVFSPKQAKKEAEEILLEHFGGFTIQEANGGWIDNDKVYRDYTLVIYLSDTDLDEVHAAADDMVEKFNQSSVLIQANETTTEFYSGKE